jgi:hypothetical protein
MEDLLAGVFHPRGRPRDRDGQFISANLELGLLRGLPHPRHGIPEFLVGGRERQRPFGLNFEDRRGAVGIHGVDDHVVKRMARSTLLESNGSYGRTRQAPRFGAGKQRQKIERADFSLELRAGAAGRCRRRNLLRFRTFFGHGLRFNGLDFFDAN